MAESWTLSVGGRVYGPYSLEQMQGLHAEKRLASHSLIAREGEEQFHPAGEDHELAPLFAARTEAKSEPARFGQRQDSEGAPGHFVIVADVKSCPTEALEEEIFSLGQAHRFGPQAWVLCAAISINAIRMALVQKVGKTDTLFIVDAAHDKAAWFNFGPETDSRIRKIWSRPSDYQGTEKRAASRS